MVATPEMGDGMKISRVFLGFICLLLAALSAHADSYYVTVAGLGGEPDYDQRFTSNAQDLDKLFKASGAGVHVYTLTGADATRDHLTTILGQVAHDAKPDDSFALIMIGHGTYDGVEYKFNLPGPDITAEDLAALCNKVPAKRQLIVNTTSASGGSIPAFQKAGRAIITATKSGTEKNATVFARYLVEALQDPTSDLDKDETISALEAYKYAAAKTAAFYESQKRLATEHPVFEDTGKNDAVREASTDTGEGLLLSEFTMVRMGAAQKAAADPAKHDLMARKEELEQTIDMLKYQKAAMDDDDYKKQLQAALLELARVEEDLDK
jgi:hypothetical protein